MPGGDADISNPDSTGQDDSQSNGTTADASTGGGDGGEEAVDGKSGPAVAILVSLICIALLVFAGYAFRKKFPQRNGGGETLNTKRGPGFNASSQHSSGTEYRHEGYCHVPVESFWVDTPFEKLFGSTTWKRKYFYLTESKLHRFSDQKTHGGKKEESIVITDISKVIGTEEDDEDSLENPSRPQGYLFGIEYTTDIDLGEGEECDILYMESPSEDEKQKWIDVLNGETRKGKKSDLQVFKTLSEMSPPSEVSGAIKVNEWATDIGGVPEEESIHSSNPNSEGIYAVEQGSGAEA